MVSSRHRGSRLLPAAALLILLFLAGWALRGSRPAAAQAEVDPWRVGVSHMPPFAIRHADGWDGLAVHLWEQSALALDIPYELVEIEREAGLSLIRTGRLDLVLTGVATAETEQFSDFTHSYYTTMVGFAEPGGRTLLEIVRAVLSQRFLQIAFWIIVALIVVGTLIWLFERRRNEEMFGGGPRQGIWSGFWWGAATLSTVGYGDKTPVSTGGRILALVWMVLSLAITASLTATVTSVLTTGVTSSTTFPEDLRGTQVGTMEGSVGADYLESEGIPFSTLETPVVGLRAVQEGELDFFVYDLAFLRYLNHENFGDGLTVVPAYTRASRYAFMLPAGSTYVEPLNQVLLEEMNSARWQAVLNRFLPIPGRRGR